MESTFEAHAHNMHIQYSVQQFRLKILLLFNEKLLMLFVAVKTKQSIIAGQNE
jgi:hypothetical protein